MRLWVHVETIIIFFSRLLFQFHNLSFRKTGMAWLPDDKPERSFLPWRAEIWNANSPGVLVEGADKCDRAIFDSHSKSTPSSVQKNCRMCKLTIGKIKIYKRLHCITFSPSHCKKKETRHNHSFLLLLQQLFSIVMLTLIWTLI